MRKAQSLEKVKFPAPEVTTKVVPVPTDGWDAISPLADMDPKRAPILDNWVPRPGWIELRAGYEAFCYTGSSTPVESLMVYHGTSGDQMFAAAGSKIYNVSTMTPMTAVSGANSARWQYINFTNSGGVHVLQCVNGVDPLQQFDGTTWTVPSITGISSSQIINIYAQKARLWYILNASTQVAFMPTGAISGPIASILDLGPTWTKGGTLVAMADWTIDGGSGPQDYAVFLSSQGQITIYQGTDPTNAAAWSLVGVFEIAPPIGNRPFFRLGSDVAIITLQGVLPISQVLPFDPSADRSVALTARIQNAMASAAQLYSGNFGWELITYPAQTLLFLNIPTATNAAQMQFVMNTLTGAWCRFLGWNANTFALFDNILYFGDNLGFVNQAYTSGTDAANPITATLQCAFNWFEDPGRLKRMTMLQPLITSDGTVTPNVSVAADFGVAQFSAPVSTPVAGSDWGVSTWGNGVWSAGTSTSTAWQSTEVLGHALAVQMTAKTAPGVFGIFDISTFDNGLFDVSPGSQPVLQINAFNAVIEYGGYI